MRKVYCLSIASVLIGLFQVVNAQPPRGPFVVSPKVHADKTVTFSYLAPDAHEVLLSGQFAKEPVPMEKGEQGIWSVTVGPIEPDIYPYSFKVDGITVMDPANEAYFPNERFKASLVDIPGDEPLVHALQDVPHGTITYEYYPSVEGTTGSLVVYTPPGYDEDTDKDYPVFYLISGTTDTEETWFKVGKANLILDNLIAQGKAQPMIIVMPYGNIAARVAEQKDQPKPDDPMRGGSDAEARAQAFEDDLVDNIIPYIDNSYRTISDRESRAIGGFSRGGGQTLRTAFGNMDTFAWICCYSAYLTPEDMNNKFASIAGDPEETNEELDLLWVSVGDEDFLYDGTIEFMDYLKTHQINYKSLISGGGHTWMNTKKYLAETAQLLFQ
uniref:Alpha/beta hydrolase-fold protein n=1 Tax=Roseihalotalea indica TaxID=2867963 RepID=A0AA49GIW2_9BACT|nr:alpha/beta hydrolase-fold protein [Tunicatimonas sp. TK19036]